MKNSINGFNQRKLIENGLKIEDAYLLDHLLYLSKDGKLDRITVDGEDYIWIGATLLSKDFPILGSVRTVTRRLDKYTEAGLIKRVLKYEHKGKKGSYCFINVTDMTKGMIGVCQEDTKRCDSFGNTNTHFANTLNTNTNNNIINDDGNYKVSKQVSNVLVFECNSEDIAFLKTEYNLTQIYHSLSYMQNNGFKCRDIQEFRRRLNNYHNKHKTVKSQANIKINKKQTYVKTTSGTHSKTVTPEMFFEGKNASCYEELSDTQKWLYNMTFNPKINFKRVDA